MTCVPSPDPREHLDPSPYATEAESEHVLTRLWARVQQAQEALIR